MGFINKNAKWHDPTSYTKMETPAQFMKNSRNKHAASIRTHVKNLLKQRKLWARFTANMSEKYTTTTNTIQNFTEFVRGLGVNSNITKGAFVSRIAAMEFFEGLDADFQTEMMSYYAKYMDATKPKPSKTGVWRATTNHEGASIHIDEDEFVRILQTGEDMIDQFTEFVRDMLNGCKILRAKDEHLTKHRQLSSQLDMISAAHHKYDQYQRSRTD